MRILLTGATGYIGKRLLPVLLEQGHEVVCAVRDQARFKIPERNASLVKVVEVDFLREDRLDQITGHFDRAYFLIHSMNSGSHAFHEMEALSATNFCKILKGRGVEQVIYLSGIVNDASLSKHLESRKNVEEVLREGDFALTTLRAGIIVGSGSASFEIIRDLVEKLPVMIAPKWLRTRGQPIGIRNVIEFLDRVKDYKPAYGKSYDITGPDILTYKEMLLRFAKVRGLQRYIFTVPVMTPRLSSYWLYFVTSTSYRLAVNLVDSMKVEVIGEPNTLAEKLGIKPMTYEEALENAFQKIEQNQILSSWKDSMVSGVMDTRLSDYVQVPKYGCFIDERSMLITNREKVLDNLWSLGGEQGWYAQGLWEIRGFMDKLVGGVGLRRGRSHPTELHAGDSLDFWRVLLADRKQGRLLLLAEMKLPGEAWLEFKIDKENRLWQTATFRPKGVLGRLYWFAVLPLHGLVFSGMLRRLGQC